jgi:hypothetical protein
MATVMMNVMLRLTYAFIIRVRGSQSGAKTVAAAVSPFAIVTFPACKRRLTLQADNVTMGKGLKNNNYIRTGRQQTYFAHERKSDSKVCIH